MVVCTIILRLASGVVTSNLYFLARLVLYTLSPSYKLTLMSLLTTFHSVGSDRSGFSGMQNEISKRVDRSLGHVTEWFCTYQEGGTKVLLR